MIVNCVGLMEWMWKGEYLFCVAGYSNIALKELKNLTQISFAVECQQAQMCSELVTWLTVSATELLLYQHNDCIPVADNNMT
jgi:hypothetical protein